MKNNSFRDAENWAVCPQCGSHFGWNAEDELKGQSCACGYLFIGQEAQPSAALRADQKKKKLARLTPAEDKAWVAALTYALTELRYGQERADRYAWRDVCKQFPRLSAFDGSLA